MVVQPYKFATNHWIVYLQYLNLMTYREDADKTVKKKI